jgi:hypothetical protein
VHFEGILSALLVGDNVHLRLFSDTNLLPDAGVVLGELCTLIVSSVLVLTPNKFKNIVATFWADREWMGARK